MFAKVILPVLSGIALANAQVSGPAPAVSILSATKSGVLPVAPTPFVGEPTIEGAITYDGAPNPGFTGVYGDAVVQQNTPGTTYTAMLPSTNFDPFTGSLITGSITATVPADGAGVMITVNFTGFPSEAEYGQFVYHIHGMPVPADGNCTSTMGHLDPTDRGELYPCDNTKPQSCQAGDLAGKHGNITMESFTASYTDLYLSTNASSAYFFGDKSVVIHTSNTTRLTCANFMLSSSSSTSSMPSGMATSTSAASPTSSGAAMFTGAAVHTYNTGDLLKGGFFAALAALFL